MTPNTSYAYTIGAGGPVTTSLPVTTAGNTSFTVGTTTITAFGGQNGVQLLGSVGGLGGGNATGGDLNFRGDNGQPGFSVVPTFEKAGSSGGGPGIRTFGFPSLPSLATLTNSPVGYGGGAAGASFNQTTTAGAPGAIIVTEFT